jgi:hypothetical protein
MQLRRRVPQHSLVQLFDPQQLHRRMPQHHPDSWPVDSQQLRGTARTLTALAPLCCLHEVHLNKSLLSRHVASLHAHDMAFLLMGPK